MLSGRGVISVGLPWPRNQSIILHLRVFSPGAKTSRLNSNFCTLKTGASWCYVVLSMSLESMALCRIFHIDYGSCLSAK